LKSKAVKAGPSYSIPRSLVVDFRIDNIAIGAMVRAGLKNCNFSQTNLELIPDFSTHCYESKLPKFVFVFLRPKSFDDELCIRAAPDLIIEKPGIGTSPAISSASWSRRASIPWSKRTIRPPGT